MPDRKPIAWKLHDLNADMVFWAERQEDADAAVADPLSNVEVTPLWAEPRPPQGPHLRGVCSNPDCDWAGPLLKGHSSSGETGYRCPECCESCEPWPDQGPEPIAPQGTKREPAPEETRGDPRDSGCLCQKCGRRYRVDLWLPTAVWESMVGPPPPDGGPLLCGYCILDELEGRGFGAWELSDPHAPQGLREPPERCALHCVCWPDGRCCTCGAGLHAPAAPQDAESEPDIVDRTSWGDEPNTPLPTVGELEAAIVRHRAPQGTERERLACEINDAIDHEIPHPEHAQEIVFEGCGVLAIAPEQYERAHSLLVQAAAESGYSERRLREMVSDGTIPQAGRKGAPRIRRGDLPIRPRRQQASEYDPHADAQELLAKSRHRGSRSSA